MEYLKCRNQLEAVNYVEVTFLVARVARPDIQKQKKAIKLRPNSSHAINLHSINLQYT